MAGGGGCGCGCGWGGGRADQASRDDGEREAMMVWAGPSRIFLSASSSAHEGTPKKCKQKK